MKYFSIRFRLPKLSKSRTEKEHVYKRGHFHLLIQGTFLESPKLL
jgi:hypothetical protein